MRGPVDGRLCAGAQLLVHFVPLRHVLDRLVCERLGALLHIPLRGAGKGWAVTQLPSVQRQMVAAAAVTEDARCA